MSLALLALSACTYALGFAEFVAVSLVPAIAASTGLSIASVGMMVGIYAIAFGSLLGGAAGAVSAVAPMWAGWVPLLFAAVLAVRLAPRPGSNEPGRSPLPRPGV